MKKEIVIDGTGSDWFEKAIFVLKEEDKEKIPKDLFSYAEEIIESHLKKMPQSAGRTLNMPKAYSNKGDRIELQKQYETIRREKERVKKRVKYVNSFLTISLIMCALSLIALILSNFS